MNNPLPEECSAKLLFFIFDVPYLSWKGVLPPFAHLNKILKTGGRKGGMSPGTTWEPIQISESEYEELCDCALKAKMSEIKNHARFTLEKIIIDHSFDNIRNHPSWMKAIAEKHGS